MTIIRAQAGNRGGLRRRLRRLGWPTALATPVLSLAATGGNPGQPAIRSSTCSACPACSRWPCKVKIAELNRTAARGFGVERRRRPSTSATAATEQAVPGLAAQRHRRAAALRSSPSFDGDDVDIGIRYLQQHGVIRLLSEPTLVTLSGRPATFIAGGEFAVPTSSAASASTP